VLQRKPFSTTSRTAGGKFGKSPSVHLFATLADINSSCWVGLAFKLSKFGLGAVIPQYLHETQAKVKPDVNIPWQRNVLFISLSDINNRIAAVVNPCTEITVW